MWASSVPHPGGGTARITGRLITGSVFSVAGGVGALVSWLNWHPAMGTTAIQNPLSYLENIASGSSLAGSQINSLAVVGIIAGASTPLAGLLCFVQPLRRLGAVLALVAGVSLTTVGVAAVAPSISALMSWTKLDASLGPLPAYVTDTARSLSGIIPSGGAGVSGLVALAGSMAMRGGASRRLLIRR